MVKQKNDEGDDLVDQFIEDKYGIKISEYFLPDGSVDPQAVS